MPQASVAIGLATLGARAIGGDAGSALLTIVLASSVLNELLGPALVKLSLYLSKSYSNKIEDKVEVKEIKEDGTIIPPSEFIHVFEEDGLIVLLDEYMFCKVCERLQKIKREGAKLYPISVNLSRATLSHKNTIEKYANIVKDYDIPIELVPLEITETTNAYIIFAQEDSLLYTIVSLKTENHSVGECIEIGKSYEFLALTYLKKQKQYKFVLHLRWAFW